MCTRSCSPNGCEYVARDLNTGRREGDRKRRPAIADWYEGRSISGCLPSSDRQEFLAVLLDLVGNLRVQS